MVTVNSDQFENYLDDSNNMIISDTDFKVINSKISFLGKNNLVSIGKNTTLVNFQVHFQGDNSHFCIGDNSQFIGNVIVGSGCSIRIGNNFKCAGQIFITVAEETKVSIGNNCMFNANIQIRSHDTHPIFDVITHKRVNESKSIHLGDNIWLGNNVYVLKGVSIGDHSIIGLNSTVTKSIPNNCLAVGVPAVVKRKDIEWRSLGLTMTPFPDFND